MSETDAYWRNADANQAKLQLKFQQLKSTLRSVSTEMLESILFDNLDPDTTRRALNSARENPVIDIVLGHEYHIEGLVTAGHGRHDRAQHLRIYCGAAAPVAAGEAWFDHPVRDDSTEATLHVYGLMNIEDLAHIIASNGKKLRTVTIVAAAPNTADPDTPDQVAQAAALAQQLHQRGVRGLSLPTDHLTTDTAREVLRKTTDDIALDEAKPQTGQSAESRSPLNRLSTMCSAARTRLLRS